MDEIKTYLAAETKDFETGYNLLSARLKHKRLLAHILRKKLLSKVIYELEKIAGRGSALAPAKAEPQLVKERRFSQELLSDAPKEIIKLYEVSCDLYKELRGAHSAMRAAANDESRAQFRADVVDFSKQVKYCYEMLDQWGSTGVVPNLSKSTESKPASEYSHAEINAASVSLSRDLKTLARTKDEKKRAIRLEAIKHNYEILKSVGRKFKPSTIDELTQIGILTAE